jgi:glucose-1-phosphate cytidylyltransferase
MKVVIFCGGMGVRMGEATQRIPKPMIPVGSEPILLHIMRWYANWGHNEFILCLGYRAEMITRYFHAQSSGSSYNGGSRNGLFAVPAYDGPPIDVADWDITCLDTGVHASIADRLRATAPYLGDDDIFLCTYGDGLTDAPLDLMVGLLVESEKTALFMSVRPRSSYHVIDAAPDGTVRSIVPMETADVRINGGFFVFRRRILDYLRPGLDIMDVSARLAEMGEILAYRYDGFWAPMDTMKDKQDLDAIAATGTMPWLGRSKTLLDAAGFHPASIRASEALTEGATGTRSVHSLEPCVNLA